MSSSVPDSVQNDINGQLEKFKTLLEYSYSYHKDSIDLANKSDIAFNSFLQAMDNKSYYFTSEQYKSMKEANTGIKKTFGFTQLVFADTCYVFQVEKGSSAEINGIIPGWRIISVNEEKVISLNYSIPLGGVKTKAIKQRLKIIQAQNKLRLDSHTDGVKGDVENLQIRIKAREKIVDISRFKMQIAGGVVSDTHKLYLKGRASFEDVLRAEEESISASVSYTNSLYNLEESYINLAYISGQTLLFLEGYID